MHHPESGVVPLYEDAIASAHRGRKSACFLSVTRTHARANVHHVLARVHKAAPRCIDPLEQIWPSENRSTDTWSTSPQYDSLPVQHPTLLRAVSLGLSYWVIEKRSTAFYCGVVQRGESVVVLSPFGGFPSTLPRRRKHNALIRVTTCEGQPKSRQHNKVQNPGGVARLYCAAQPRRLDRFW